MTRAVGVRRNRLCRVTLQRAKCSGGEGGGVYVIWRIPRGIAGAEGILFLRSRRNVGGGNNGRGMSVIGADRYRCPVRSTINSRGGCTSASSCSCTGVRTGLAAAGGVRR